MKKNLLLLLLLLLPLAANADAVEIDGIFYNLDPMAKTAEVTSGSNIYTGNVVIPETVTYEGTEYSVTSIGERTFSACTALASVTIPNSVISIGSFAFSNCYSLTSVTIPNSVTSIGESAFAACFYMTSVHISDIAAWCSIDFKDIDSNPLGYAHQLYVNGVEVKDLAIPNSVTSIGDSTFSECSSLTSVTIGTSVTSIGERAFDGCSGLTSITIPNSVTFIGNLAFDRCFGLTSVTIGTSLTSIGKYVFAVCRSLTSVTLGNSVTSIGEGAFANCSSLLYVTIPNSVTSIGDGAFWKCSGLISVTIGSGVQTINSWAFAYCQVLEDVYCHAENVPSTIANAFTDSNIENATLHVPATSIEAYKSTDPWSGFKTIVAISSKGDVNGDGQVGIGDLIAVSNFMGGEGSVTFEQADVNGDGEVGIGDIISITNIMAE